MKRASGIYLCDFNKQLNISVIRVPEGKEKEGKKKLLGSKETKRNDC